jgi:hypothetical protein
MWIAKESVYTAREGKGLYEYCPNKPSHVICFKESTILEGEEH